MAFFLPAAAYATRIRGGVGAWGRVLRPRVRRALRPIWLPALAASSLLFLLALEASVYDLESARDPSAVLAGVRVEAG